MKTFIIVIFIMLIFGNGINLAKLDKSKDNITDSLIILVQFIIAGWALYLLLTN